MCITTRNNISDIENDIYLNDNGICIQSFNITGVTPTCNLLSMYNGCALIQTCNYGVANCENDICLYNNGICFTTYSTAFTSTMLHLKPSNISMGDTDNCIVSDGINYCTEIRNGNGGNKCSTICNYIDFIQLKTCSGGTSTASVDMSNGSICLSALGGGYTTRIYVNPDSVYICNDTPTFGGVQYCQDYSPYITCLSIPNAGWVTGQTGGGGSGFTIACNGLHSAGQTVGLGGDLTGDTYINLNNKYLFITGGTDFFGLTVGQSDACIGDYNGNNVIYHSMGISQITQQDVSGDCRTQLYMTPTQLTLIREYSPFNTKMSICYDTTTLNLGTCSGATNFSCLEVGLGVMAIYGCKPTGFQGVRYVGVDRNNFVCNSLVDAAYVTGLTTNGGVTGATNGLSVSGKKVGLGGTLTGDTTIELNNYDFNINNTNIGFIIGTGFTVGNGVFALAVQPDNKIIAGGAFVSYSGVTANKIIRLNVDGSVDNTFNAGSGPDAFVYTITRQTDGKLIVGGNFTTYSGQTANYILRLNSDGSIDDTFIHGALVGGVILSSSIQPDGKILIGGGFNNYSGITSCGIVRLNSDGTHDTSFYIGSGSVYSMGLQSDGKIIAVGNFLTYSGQSSRNIVRINTDGTLDTTYNVGTGFDYLGALSVAIQNDNKAVVTGWFYTYSGVTVNHIVRLNTNGTVDNTFINGGFDNATDALKIQPDGKILVGGSYATYSGVSATRIIRLNSNGTIDNTFNINSSNGLNGTPSDFAVQSNGNIIVGGDFTTYNNISSSKIVGLHRDGIINNSNYAYDVKFNGKVIEYGANYSSQYTNRSLVDAAYVTGKTNAISTVSITGATSLGTGCVVYSTVTNNNLKFKSLSGGSNITLSSDANTITICSTGVSSKTCNITGDGSATGFTISHSYGTRDVAVQVYENQSPYGTVLVAVQRPTINDICVLFTVAPPVSTNYRVIIQK